MFVGLVLIWINIQLLSCTVFSSQRFGQFFNSKGKSQNIDYISSGTTDYDIPEYLLVDSEQEEHDSCGAPINPCRSIENAIKTYPEALNVRINNKGILASEGTLYFDHSITLTGLGNDPTKESEYSELSIYPVSASAGITLSTEDPNVILIIEKLAILFSVLNSVTTYTGGLLAIIEGKANVESYSPSIEMNTVYVHKESSLLEPLHAPIIVADLGILKLTACTFSELVLDSSPLLIISPGSGRVYCSETQFRSIIRQNGDGSVLQTTVSTGSDLRLSGCSFHHCGCVNGNGGALYVKIIGGAFRLGAVSTDTNSKVQFEKCFVGNTLESLKGNMGDESTSFNGGSFYITVEQTSEQDQADIVLAHVEVEESTATGSGGGMFIDVAKEAKQVKINLADISVRNSVSGSSGSGNAIYLNLRNPAAQLKLNSITVEHAAVIDNSHSKSTVYIEVTNEKLANDATLWSEIKTLSEGKTSSSGDESFVIATRHEDDSVTEKTTKEIIAEATPKSGKTYWWIVFPILAFVIIIVILVAADYYCVCKKDTEDEKATKYEERNIEEMETFKYEDDLGEDAPTKIPSLEETSIVDADTSTTCRPTEEVNVKEKQE